VKKEAAVVLELREELANARQEGAKSLESAQAKEAKLTVELNQRRVMYKGKAKASDRMVDEDDELEELRNGVEFLKVRTTVIPLVKGSGLLIQNRKGWQSWRRKMQSLLQRRLNHIQTKRTLVSFYSIDRQELKYPFLGYGRLAPG
jgi:hypothetical protein